MRKEDPTDLTSNSPGCFSASKSDFVNKTLLISFNVSFRFGSFLITLH